MSERLISGFCPGAETARMDRVENHRVSLCSRLTGRGQGGTDLQSPGPSTAVGAGPTLAPDGPEGGASSPRSEKRVLHQEQSLGNLAEAGLDSVRGKEGFRMASEK